MLDALRFARETETGLFEAADVVGPEMPGRHHLVVATRDRLSRDLFEVNEEVAAYGWDTDRVQVLLRRVSSAMRDEVDHLEARAARQATGPTQALVPAVIRG